MGRSNTLPISQPHSHSNGSIKTIGTTSIRKPERSKSSHSYNVSTTHTFPIPTRHSSQQQNSHPYYIPPPSERSSYRPNGPNRQNSVQTRYMSMLLSLDTIPRLHNILASFFTWILLAGFIIFPGTFTSLQTSLDDNKTITSSTTATALLHSFKHLSLLIVGGISSGIGALGMIFLWYKWSQNYVWLLNRIFLPGCLNSFAGLISTLINVYSQQGGQWSVTARVTAAVTGGSMVVTGVLFGLYNFWILERVKRSHGREMEREGLGKEGLVEKMGRKAHEPALEPGSVV